MMTFFLCTHEIATFWRLLWTTTLNRDYPYLFYKQNRVGWYQFAQIIWSELCNVLINDKLPMELQLQIIPHHVENIFFQIIVFFLFLLVNWWFRKLMRKYKFQINHTMTKHQSSHIVITCEYKCLHLFASVPSS